MDATCLATCVERTCPGSCCSTRHCSTGWIRCRCGGSTQHRQHVRVLLLSDEICHGLVADVLRNRFHGFLLTTSPPDVCLKAIRAVSKGELWLSRASLAMAIVDLLGLSVPEMRSIGRSATRRRHGSAHAEGVAGRRTTAPRMHQQGNRARTRDHGRHRQEAPAKRLREAGRAPPRAGRPAPPPGYGVTHSIRARPDADAQRNRNGKSARSQPRLCTLNLRLTAWSVAGFGRLSGWPASQGIPHWTLDGGLPPTPGAAADRKS